MKSETEQLISAIEHVAESVVITDLEGLIVYVNPAFENVTGYSRAEVIGVHTRVLKSGQHPHSFYRTMWETLLAGETWSGDLINKRKDGSLFDEVATISPIKNEAGIVVSYVAVKRDVTQELLLRRQLAHAQKMEAVGELTGGIAHDFNNLLGVIIGNIELTEPLLSENSAALRRVLGIKRAAERGADLTKRLLAFARTVELNPTPIDLHENISSTVELFRTLAPDLTITTQFDALSPLVMVDAAGLESALLNLAINARDAMPNGGTLNISTQLLILKEDDRFVKSGELRAGTYAMISVADNGQGISQKIMERVFEPFFTTKPMGKGSGLGLAMFYGFVRQSGGAAQISSEIGCGTTVSFCLQLADKMGVPSLAPVVGEARVESLSGKALIVDDEPDLLEVAALYLERLGYTVFQAQDSESALEVIKEHKDINLLVADIIMPGGLNGIELAERVCLSLPHIKVVYTSGYPANAMGNPAIPIQPPFLQKPYRIADLDASIRIALK